jgi:hypothetical protein
MTAQTKKYLKIVIGSILVLSALLGPKPLWSWNNAKGFSYNVDSLAIFGKGLLLLYWAGQTK